MAKLVKKTTLIILGPQASGKGTQAEILSEEFGIPVLSAGKVSKNARDRQDSTGETVRKLYDQGKLLPIDLLSRLISEELERMHLNDGIIFEGMPRSEEQIKMLNDLKEKFSLADPWFIYLKISDNTVYKRIKGRKVCQGCNIPYLPSNLKEQQEQCSKCGGKLITRPDDTEEALKERLRIFHSESEKIIEHYRKLDRLIEVDGEKSIPDVAEEVEKQLINKGIIQ